MKGKRKAKNLLSMILEWGRGSTSDIDSSNLGKLELIKDDVFCFVELKKDFTEDRERAGWQIVQFEWEWFVNEKL